MKINFDNMRTQMANRYDELVEKYNRKETDLSEELHELGTYIGSLLCIYDETQENFSDLGDRDLLEIRVLKTTSDN